MGTSMFAFVECDTGSAWELVIDGLYPRGYDMMGCLFGVRNYANFDPVAPDRGWPDDVSEPLRERRDADRGYGHSWLSLAEIERIDWDEPAEAVDRRTSFYDADGDRLGKAAIFNYEFEEDDYMDAVRAGERVTVTLAEQVDGYGLEAGDEMVLVRERRTRGEVKHPGYEEIFDAMWGLGRRYGEDGVRLLVHFTN